MQIEEGQTIPSNKILGFVKFKLYNVNVAELLKLIKAVEEIKIKDIDGKKHSVLAKIDTGAWSSAIDKKYARKLGLLQKDRILWFRDKLSSLGREARPVIPVTFFLGGRKLRTNMTVADRKLLRYDVLIGRIDLQGFLVSPEIDKKDLVKAKWS